jgi:glycosyltransferase involved in cell wall biosynthesis
MHTSAGEVMGEAISLCMIVKNEEPRLAKCLDSARNVADEVVIVDTGSTDGSREIASSYGAKIIAFDFTVVDFAAARNHALARANGRWILVLDADERLDASSVPLIEEIAKGEENAGYYLERLNHRPNGEAPRTDYVVRLFPNRPDYRYRGRVHETTDASILAGGGRLVKTAIRLDHDFASDPEARRRRNLAYVEILNEEIAADPSDHTRFEFLAAEYHQLGMFDRAAEITEHIVSMRPLDPQAHFHAGAYHWLYQRNGERARADFREALRLRRGYAEAESFLRAIEEQEGWTQTDETAQ